MGGKAVGAKETVEVAAGTTVTVRTPGGGYGDSTERDEELAEINRANGKVTDEE